MTFVTRRFVLLYPGVIKIQIKKSFVHVKNVCHEYPHDYRHNYVLFRQITVVSNQLVLNVSWMSLWRIDKLLHVGLQEVIIYTAMLHSKLFCPLLISCDLSQRPKQKKLHCLWFSFRFIVFLRSSFWESICINC